jgi:hypothetical protein
MRLRSAWLVAVLLFAAAAVARAQTTVAAPSAAERCLTRGEGTPAYPPQALEVRASGRVLVELEFAAPDASPRLGKIEAQSDEFADAFERSVREFIKAYRVPCLRADEKSLLKQEFVFSPHDLRGVTMLTAQDEQSARAQRLRRCMLHQRPDDKPAYPLVESSRGRQGTAVVRAEFVSPDEPARVTVLDDGGSHWFGEVARKHALGYRLPCHDGAGAVDVVQLYVFKMDGGDRVVIKDMGLLSLLRNLKGIRSTSLYFDFHTMGCPFDLRFTAMQPHALNQVGEMGAPNPERRFFLEWLSRQQLDMPQRELNALLGQSALVSVPCTVLRLGQQSGGGGSQ